MFVTEVPCIFYGDGGEIFIYFCLFIMRALKKKYTAKTRKSCMLCRDSCLVKLNSKIRFELVS